MLSDSIVVGIYGIQGVGKSHVLKQIDTERFEWRVLDGSQLIREYLDSNGRSMEDFHNMIPSEKGAVRQAAILSAKTKPGISLIAGHCSFPNQIEAGSNESITFNDVFTSADGEVYDHIICIEKSPDKVFEQIQGDSERKRPQLSIDELSMWMEHEKALLKAKCLEHGISLDIVYMTNEKDHQEILNLVLKKVEAHASLTASQKSEQALVASIHAIPDADVYLLIDGDGTLCPQDTGTLFFEQVKSLDVFQPLKKIFKRYDSYKFQAFWEVAMLYSNALPEQEYIALCDEIGREHVQVHLAWKAFLEQLPSNVHPVLVSASIREVWQAMQARHVEGNSDGLGRMSIIAGNNLLLHPYIVEDDNAKALVAKTLRKLHGGCRILCFGDSGEPSFIIDIIHPPRVYIVTDTNIWCLLE